METHCRKHYHSGPFVLSIEWLTSVLDNQDLLSSDQLSYSSERDK